MTVGSSTSPITYDEFTSYCVDLAQTVVSPAPAQAGLYTGTYADSNGYNRNIGAAAWVLNNNYLFNNDFIRLGLST